MSAGAAVAQRMCLACGAQEPIRCGEPVWPTPWRCPACGRAVAQRDTIPMFAPELADTVSGFDPALFATLAEVEPTHCWFVTRNELIIGLADRFFPAAQSCLEIGCGNGEVLRALTASRKWKRLVGAELHTTALARARNQLPLDVELVQMDACAIPAVEAFDLTGAFDVLEHIDDDTGVLRGLRRATRAGGGTIIAVPQHPWLWSRSDELAKHRRRYGRGELERKLRACGFEILFSSSFTALLLPLIAMSRLKRRDEDDEIAREFTLNERMNRVLTAILRAEVRLTLAGWRWPAGGSRVVVARAI